MYEFSKEKMGERFREIRADKGHMSLRAFCRAYGQNPETWGYLEKGLKREIYVSSLAKLARMFDVSPTWLIFGILPKELSSSPKHNDLTAADVEEHIVGVLVRLLQQEKPRPKKTIMRILERAYDRAAQKTRDVS